MIRLADVELLEYQHELDVRHATVHRRLRFRDRSGRETTLRSRRFVSMADIHHAGIEWTLVPEGWSGRVEVVSAVDGRVMNRNVARGGQLEGRHLAPVAPGRWGEVIGLKARTRQSDPMQCRGTPLHVTVERECVTVMGVGEPGTRSIEVGVGGELRPLNPGRRVRFDLVRVAPA